VTPNSDFDEIFGDLDAFNKKFMKKFQIELDDILEKIESGEIKGSWKVSRIDKPGVNGYVIQGRLDSDESSDPIEPLKPLKRRPIPERPFEIPEGGSEEKREPLIDVLEDENTIKIYVEMPGEEKDHINLNLIEGNLEIKGENFYKLVELPKRHIGIDSMSSEYKNGVLVVAIRKKEEPFSRYADKERMV
jgi:HSP20 family molecular chaperone IbpA